MKGPPRLQELRERRLLSKSELSQMAGVRIETITRLEGGEGGAWPRTVRKLADALGVSYDELFVEANAPLAGALAGDDPEERRLFDQVRPLVLLMSEQSERWEEMARSDAVASGLYREILDKRRKVMEAMEGVLESLAEEGLLDWNNQAHRPSRRARQELQGAFNRWTRAFFAVAEAHFESEMGSAPQSAEERRLATWFGDRVAS